MAVQRELPRGTRVPDIRTGDTVIVMTGKDAGKKGKVQRVLRNPQGYKKTVSRFGAQAFKRGSPLSGVHVVVEGVNIAHRHTKPSQKMGRNDRQPRVQQGGILELAQPLPASRVMILCPNCGKATRVKHGTGGDGRTTRVCSQCGENLTREAQKRD
jgi:large subunit ribosomal protein L24